MERKILFYSTIEGKSYIKEFLDRLNEKEYRKVSFVFNLIQKFEKIDSTFFKKLKGTEEIWEIKVDVNKKFIRIFCFRDKGNLIITTNAYNKKVNKTNRKEIKLAESLRKEYFKRRKK